MIRLESMRNKTDLRAPLMEGTAVSARLKSLELEESRRRKEKAFSGVCT